MLPPAPATEFQDSIWRLRTNLAAEHAATCHKVVPGPLRASERATHGREAVRERHVTALCLANEWECHVC